LIFSIRQKNIEQHQRFTVLIVVIPVMAFAYHVQHDDSGQHFKPNHFFSSFFSAGRLKRA
ncbi:hypothetical protein ACTHT3_14115, partial [Neisseria sp. P0015.S004]